MMKRGTNTGVPKNEKTKQPVETPKQPADLVKEPVETPKQPVESIDLVKEPVDPDAYALIEQLTDADAALDTVDAGVPKFTKEQLLKSHWFSHKRARLRHVLEDGKLYSYADVEKLLTKAVG